MTTQTSRVLTLELPLPEVELSPNARYTTNKRGERVTLAWQRRMRFVQAYRGYCGMVAALAIREHQRDHAAPFRPMERATLDLTFTYCHRRRLDVDGAVSSFKAGLDGLVDAGILVNDSAARLQIGSVMVRQARHRQHAAGGCPAGVLVTVREVL